MTIIFIYGFPCYTAACYDNYNYVGLYAVSKVSDRISIIKLIPVSVSE